tara:strand:+ start:34566 stop:35153 length:588 start_codon:yes stop_codon:yes gene_type:complete
MSGTSTNPLADRERSLETAFFRKVDAKLLENLRSRMARDQAIDKLAADTGIHDQHVLQELLDLNFTPQNLLALWLVPLTQVAWADGRVEPAEREAVLQALQKHGYSENSPAWHLLESWLDHKPCDEVLAVWKDYARALVESAGEKRVIALRNDLRNRAREVSQAAGGVFGFGKVSCAEESVIQQIEDALRPESDV